MVHHWPKELFILYYTVLSLGQMAQLIIITNSINCLLIASRCIPNGTDTNHFEPIWPNVSKTLICCYTSELILYLINDINLLQNVTAHPKAHYPSSVFVLVDSVNAYPMLRGELVIHASTFILI